MPKIHRFKSKTLSKNHSPLISDNKENDYIYKPKQTLENFILKELENSVSELTKKSCKSINSSILNPYAQEFIITNS